LVAAEALTKTSSQEHNPELAGRELLRLEITQAVQDIGAELGLIEAPAGVR
jgi:hypothetical protein